MRTPEMSAPEMPALAIRVAVPDDLEAIVRLHEADAVGGHGDAWTPENRPAYAAALAAIAASPDCDLYVVLEGGEVVGSFQLSFRQGITSRGARQAVLESVQVRADRRSRGVGARMVEEAERLARAGGATSLQLTSNKRRVDAHRFYERLGYARSHEGFRKPL
ncbi:GCN5-related N-acetyltransferase [Methylobacterium sp. 4-46]|uniref:GNAT family N-acetyltransferase n=1 Tax=unclassified Methylobacterium TaxID=2615210 RepID=UPI000165CBC5|nr:MULTISPECIES: GNAT family N-acetyltransferase [Methylobacterium]ACA18700.1 GCN5-related N-acetyltransferase [Methylobacterium sp. 4-46]WFT77932.1 GNAT family N-acetyltransferase [Methylobacterium nodulans]